MRPLRPGTQNTNRRNTRIRESGILKCSTRRWNSWVARQLGTGNYPGIGPPIADDGRGGYSVGIAASQVRPAGRGCCGSGSESGTFVAAPPCEAVVSSGCCRSSSITASVSGPVTTGACEGRSSKVAEPLCDVRCER